jgi:ABC-type multidrug transport system fused ATPase/permease subunit
MGSEAFFLRSYVDRSPDTFRMLFEIDAVRSGIRFVPAIVALLSASACCGRTAPAGSITAGYFFAVTILLIRLFHVARDHRQSDVGHASGSPRSTDIRELIGPQRHADMHRVATERVQFESVELKGVDLQLSLGRPRAERPRLPLRARQTVAIVGPSGSASPPWRTCC